MNSRERDRHGPVLPRHGHARRVGCVLQRPAAGAPARAKEGTDRGQDVLGRGGGVDDPPASLSGSLDQQRHAGDLPDVLRVDVASRVARLEAHPVVGRHHDQRAVEEPYSLQSSDELADQLVDQAELLQITPQPLPNRRGVLGPLLGAQARQVGLGRVAATGGGVLVGACGRSEWCRLSVRPGSIRSTNSRKISGRLSIVSGGHADVVGRLVR